MTYNMPPTPSGLRYFTIPALSCSLNTLAGLA